MTAVATTWTFWPGLYIGLCGGTILGLIITGLCVSAGRERRSEHVAPRRHWAGRPGGRCRR